MLKSHIQNCIPDLSNMRANIGLSGNSAICKPSGSVSCALSSMAGGRGQGGVRRGRRSKKEEGGGGGMQSAVG